MSAIETKPLVVCITGPTATGKTEAAVALCKALSGEALSMDSMQIYRRLSIGTAKPTIEEMDGVPHHLLSYVEPRAAYTVAEYQRDAWRAMEGVLSRGKLPVFVGGTGLYLQAVSHPLRFAEAGGAGEVRAALQRRAQEPGGPERLHARLAAVDPESAQRLHVRNTRRIIRALEIYETTGEPMSQKTNDWEAEPAQDWLIFALTWPRDTLYARINVRVDKMVASGLVEEVRGLLEDGLSPKCQAMQAIGYKEIASMLRGGCTLEEATETIKRNSRRYAKRQLTWLRRDARVRWIDRTDHTDGRSLTSALLDQIHAHRREARHDRL